MSRLTDRERAVWDKRNAGLTFKQIAKDLGLCVQTVSFAYGKAYRKIEYGKAMKINKLTEYENLGSVEDLKQLSHEIEVCKRALDKASNELADYEECFALEPASKKIKKALVNMNLTRLLDQARKELEDERK